MEELDAIARNLNDFHHGTEDAIWDVEQEGGGLAEKDAVRTTRDHLWKVLRASSELEIRHLLLKDPERVLAWKCHGIDEYGMGQLVGHIITAVMETLRNPLESAPSQQPRLRLYSGPSENEGDAAA